MKSKNNSDENSPIKSRLLEFISKKGLNPTEFARICGMSTAFVPSIRKSIDVDTFQQKIEPKFPELNKVWLYFGEGDMITNANQSDMKNQRRIEDLEKTIKVLEKQVDFLERDNERLTRELDKSPKENKDFIND